MRYILPEMVVADVACGQNIYFLKEEVPEFLESGATKNYQPDRRLRGIQILSATSSWRIFCVQEYVYI